MNKTAASIVLKQKMWHKFTFKYLRELHKFLIVLQAPQNRLLLETTMSEPTIWSRVSHYRPELAGFGWVCVCVGVCSAVPMSASLTPSSRQVFLSGFTQPIF